MTRKVNTLIAVAVAALAMPLTAATNPVAETMLDQYIVKKLGIAQVNDSGNCIMLAIVNKGGVGDVDETRAVCNSNGDVKLYGSIGATESMIKSSRFIATSDVKVTRKLKEATVSNPIANLKTKYKAFKKEAATYLANSNVLAASISAAVSDGWDTATGTPEFEEHAYFVQSKASVDEVKAFSDVKVAYYAAALTAAGVDPITVV